MNAVWLQANWALVAAAVVVCIILCFALRHVLRSTAGFRLRSAKGVLVRKRHVLRRANADVASAERRAERLQRRAERVKPRLLDEARGKVEDARALAKIAHDQVLVAENHLRRIIVEEFPPAKHDRLRAKHSLGDVPDKKPFTF